MECLRRHGVGRFVFSSTARHLRHPRRRCRSPRRRRSSRSTRTAGPSWPSSRPWPTTPHAYGWGFAALRYFNAAGASADGTIGEDHDPETHLIPLVHPGGPGPAAAHRGLRHRLPDARRHLHPRLHPRRRPGRGAPAGAGEAAAGQGPALQPRHRPRLQRPRGDPHGRGGDAARRCR